MPKKAAKGGKKKGGNAASNSKKRAAGHTEIPQGKASGGKGKLPATDINAQIDALEFEDPYGDDYEEEEAEEEENEELEDVDGSGEVVNKKMSAVEDSNTDVRKEAWRPGIDKLENGEQLEYDPRAYTMYHSFQTEWPCLSFDILNDTLGDNRQRFPHTVFLATGSQADRPENNKISLIKVSDLHKTQAHNESDSESDDDDDLDEDPTIEHVNVPHLGGVNRLRAMQQQAGVIASWSDTGKVHIYDLTTTAQSFMQRGPRVPVQNSQPVTTFAGHKDEGFAIDWSPVSLGRLASGDCKGNIHIWNPATAGASDWVVDSKPYEGHTSSVEDLQWSPSEHTVFASCSADRTVRIWDTRGRTGPQITLQAHNDDVNVISWNRQVGYLLASGCDDGSFKVWDLRTIKDNKAAPLAHFTYHKQPITSVTWAPHDESVLSISSADNQVTVWDLSVEADEDTGGEAALPAEYPPQLLFIHQGQYNVKEVHFHRQIPGLIVSTAEDSFNIFKPAISVS